MESLRTVCNKTNSKYTCIICEVFVCNKCVKAANENVDGYNKKLKRVGKCPDCDTDFTKTVPDCVITESVQAMQPPKTRKVQKSVYDMFGKSAQNITVPKNTNIMSGIAQMDQKDLERRRKKFEVAYFTAKHQLPIVTYKDF